MIRLIAKSVVVVALVSMFVVLTGCAATANYKSMIVKPTADIQKNPKLKGAIEVVNVSGGKKTNPLWTSQVDNDGFKKALESSLSAYGYLADDKAKYKLDADLLSLGQPIMGFSLDVKSKVIYKIYDAEMVKKYRIKAAGVAGVSDAFLANERLKIANERSIQENIKEFLKQLSSF